MFDYPVQARAIEALTKLNARLTLWQAAPTRSMVIKNALAKAFSCSRLAVFK